MLDLIIGKKNGTISYYENTGTTTNPTFELKNNYLGMVNVSTNNQDCFAIPHFFEFKDSIHLFVGNSFGEFYHFNTIEDNLNLQDSFNRITTDYFPLTKNAFSSYWVNDIDQDYELNVFVGQDLGGLFHFENDSLSTLSVSNDEIAPNILIYPNPFSSSLTISSENNVMNSVEIFDVLGHKIMSLSPKQSTYLLQTDQLKTGINCLKIQFANNQLVFQKIIKND